MFEAVAAALRLESVVFFCPLVPAFFSIGTVPSDCLLSSQVKAANCLAMAEFRVSST